MVAGAAGPGPAAVTSAGPCPAMVTPQARHGGTIGRAARPAPGSGGARGGRGGPQDDRAKGCGGSVRSGGRAGRVSVAKMCGRASLRSRGSD